ncbi:MAG: hypothetical protein KBG02_09590 [Haliscomenobacter sp.]|nr:hypothetical protein [Haliscomenobacter sp.]MBP9873590.1 hypothetical protein [Haliscomenobacter sp.]
MHFLKSLFLLLLTTWALRSLSAQEVALTFQVDLTPVLQEGKAPKSVGIRGSLPPLSWDQSVELKPAPGGKVYAAQISFKNLLPGALLEYKFITDEKTWELPGENRVLVWNGQDTVLSSLWNEYIPPSPDALPPLLAEQMAEDFFWLKKGLLELHPGLYRYQTEASLQALFAEFEPLFNRNMSYREAYLLISRLVGQVRCGHTYANFFNQNQLIQHAVFRQADKLPFLFRILDRRIFIAENASEHEAIPVGAEIKRVNDIPVSEIWDSLLPLVKADGNNDGKRLADLQVFGVEGFEAFDVYFPLLFPPRNGTYSLEIQFQEGGPLQTLEVNALTPKQRKEALLKRSGGYSATNWDSLWQFTVIDANAALLRLPHFQTWKMTMNWRKFLQDAFSALQKQAIPNLVIDIRNNEGGADEVIAFLSQYLVSKPIAMEPIEDRLRYEYIAPEWEPYLRSWDDSFKDFRGKVRRIDDRFYTWIKPDDPLEIPAGKKAFSGNIYLLVDETNSSATFYLAKFCKDHRLATLVGRPTGGSQRGINGGRIAFLRLPNSKIEVDIPLIGTFPLSEKPEGGIVPDVLVDMEAEAFRKGEDLILQKAMDLIKRR